ncbi:unnamed protein product [Ambrosiozyma monospora]|uniref:Unnamed protein product n=1 Tax=Ambrosiozyma monospora TaxID=43982 RepID=A0A9W7DIL4_AMBMO|nr:unnamed protein product [Ambrosiozyma monospora]
MFSFAKPLLLEQPEDQPVYENDEVTETTCIMIGGMTCSSCSNSIETALRDVPGVAQVEVSLITEEATIHHTQNVSAKQLEDIIDDIGFFPTLISTESTVEKSLFPPNMSQNDFGSFINLRAKIQQELTRYKTTISVSGMTCSNCSNAVTDMVSKVPGVSHVEVSLITEDAVIQHDSSVESDVLKQTIEDCGFEAIVKKTEEIRSTAKSRRTTEDVTSAILRITGMTCASCSGSIEQQVNGLPGIKSCYVALTTEEARIEYDANTVGIRDIISYGIIGQN